MITGSCPAVTCPVSFGVLSRLSSISRNCPVVGFVMALTSILCRVGCASVMNLGFGVSLSMVLYSCSMILFRWSNLGGCVDLNIGCLGVRRILCLNAFWRCFLLENWTFEVIFPISFFLSCRRFSNFLSVAIYVSGLVLFRKYLVHSPYLYTFLGWAEE